MREDETIKTLCKLEERTVKDINKTLEKNDIPANEWNMLKTATDIIVNIWGAQAMKENGNYGEEQDYERGMMRSYRNGMMHYPMGDDFAGGRMRAANGQYRTGNYENGYYTGGDYNRNSYAGGNSSYNTGSEAMGVVANLRNLMNSANSETERMMYKKLLNEAEGHVR